MLERAPFLLCRATGVMLVVRRGCGVSIQAISGYSGCPPAGTSVFLFTCTDRQQTNMADSSSVHSDGSDTEPVITFEDSGVVTIIGFVGKDGLYHLPVTSNEGPVRELTFNEDNLSHLDRDLGNEALKFRSLGPIKAFGITKDSKILANHWEALGYSPESDSYIKDTEYEADLIVKVGEQYYLTTAILSHRVMAFDDLGLEGNVTAFTSESLVNDPTRCLTRPMRLPLVGSGPSFNFEKPNAARMWNLADGQTPYGAELSRESGKTPGTVQHSVSVHLCPWRKVEKVEENPSEP
jgi:hypothetical protein